tara:strand:+ start:1414 stop:2613 length:1200 start_codon:yes stop_codon:yes gene_type:complete
MMFFSKTRVASLFVILFCFSLLSGLLVGVNFGFDSGDSIEVLFICLMLAPFYLTLNLFKGRGLSRTFIRKKTHSVYWFVALISAIFLFINLYVLYKSIGYYFSIGVTVGEYNNSGGAESFLTERVSPVLFGLISAASPLAYVSLGAHFIFLVRGEKLKAAVAFIGSLSIVVFSLLELARSGVVLYILIYFGLLLYVYDVLPFNQRASLIKIVSFFFLCLFSILIWVSFSRFDVYVYQGAGFISNPALYSIFHYLSQWLVNGVEIIKVFSVENIMFGSNFSYIPNRVLSAFGGEPADILARRLNAYGMYATKFNGMPAILLYDFGFLGALLYSWIFYALSYLIIKGSRRLEFKVFAFLMIFPMIAMFFQGVVYISGYLNVAIIYMMLVYLVSRIRVRIWN